MLESAIPPHLMQARTQPPRMPSADYTPPTAAYCARFPESITEIVMVIIGTQSRDPKAEVPLEALSPVLQRVKGGASADGLTGQLDDCQPSCWDLVSYRDVNDLHNMAVIAYWSRKTEYDYWNMSSGFEDWWQKLDPETMERGWFREVLFPSVDRYETIFSDHQESEGAARMRAGMSGPVQEHVYWGSMRDRMAAAQTDALAGDPLAAPLEAEAGQETTERRRIKIPAKKNLCIIRSGQDWSATTPRERKLYLETMHPVLVKGMNFLRDEGQSIGCYSCRFMDVLDPLGTIPTERTFGLALFDDMSSLENWSKRHKTHLDIFGRFLQYARELDNKISLRLFHEVLVLTPEQQLFEYVGCRRNTGLLVGNSF